MLYIFLNVKFNEDLASGQVNLKDLILRSFPLLTLLKY